MISGCKEKGTKPDKPTWSKHLHLFVPGSNIINSKDFRSYTDYIVASAESWL